VVTSSPVDIAILRPGIVWGPRSHHTAEIVDSLLEKRAFIVNEGNGIFNGIYIDNLISSIQACINDTSDIRDAFNIADSEQVSWRQFYSALADYLDYDMSRIVRVSSRHFPWSRRAAIDYSLALPGVNRMYHVLKSRLPAGLKANLKSRLGGSVAYERPFSTYESAPYVSRELWHLQQTRFKLPTTKFLLRFGVAPPVSFEEGILRTVSWLCHLGMTARVGCCAT
jgi:nucleoside-diphosphate-sugar epimerase